MRLARFHRSAIIALAAATLFSVAAFARDTVAEGSFDRTLKVSGAVDLTISTGSGSISVRTGSGSEIHIVGKFASTRDGTSTSRTRRRESTASSPIPRLNRMAAW